MALALLSLALSLAGRQGATPQFVQFKAKLYSLDTQTRSGSNFIPNLDLLKYLKISCCFANETYHTNSNSIARIHPVMYVGNRGKESR